MFYYTIEQVKKLGRLESNICALTSFHESKKYKHDFQKKKKKTRLFLFCVWLRNAHP